MKRQGQSNSLIQAAATLKQSVKPVGFCLNFGKNLFVCDFSCNADIDSFTIFQYSVQVRGSWKIVFSWENTSKTDPKTKSTKAHSKAQPSLPPGDALHAARLRYLGRMVRNCPGVLWNLLQAARSHPQSWLSACGQSFFNGFVPSMAPLLDQHTVMTWTLGSLSCWNGRVTRASQSCSQYRQANAEAKLWQKTFDNTMLASGAQLPRRSTAPTERWECDQYVLIGLQRSEPWPCIRHVCMVTNASASIMHLVRPAWPVPSITISPGPFGAASPR